MLMLKNEILDPLLLRRTKDTRAEDIRLPPRLVRLRHDRMDEREEDFYEALYTQSQAQFNTYLQSGTVLNNYAHIFDILIRCAARALLACWLADCLAGCSCGFGPARLVCMCGLVGHARAAFGCAHTHIHTRASGV